MKRSIFGLVIFSSLLFSCVQVYPSSNSGSSSSGEETSSTAAETSSTNEETSSSIVNEIEQFTLFSVNDIHGTIERDNTSGYEVGMARLKYAIEHDEDYDPDNSMIVCGGDSYQGGYLSFYDKQLTSDLMNLLGVKAMVVGNHEFDWGIDTLKEMIEGSQDYFPMLGCNVYENSTNKKVDFLTPSVTLTTNSGIKVGLVGAIGPSQTSSIKTSVIQDYFFSSSVNIIYDQMQSLSDCDFRFLLVHDSVNDSNYIQKVLDSLASRNALPDGVVGGHTHVFEAETYQGVPFVQGGCNTKGYTKMTFDFLSKENTYYGYNQMDASDYNVSDSLLDQDMLALINESPYKQDGDLGMGVTFNSSFRRYYELNRFIPEAMLYEADKYGYGTNNRPLIAIHNLGGIRANIPAGEITRAELFKVVPFDNKVRVLENVSGSSIQNAIGRTDSSASNTTNSYCYAISDDSSLSSSVTYDVVTIDYVYEGSYFTRNVTSDWDSWIKMDQTNNEDVNMPDLLRDYILTCGVTTFYASDYNIYA